MANRKQVQRSQACKYFEKKLNCYANASLANIDIPATGEFGKMGEILVSLAKVGYLDLFIHMCFVPKMP